MTKAKDLINIIFIMNVLSKRIAQSSGTEFVYAK